MRPFVQMSLKTHGSYVLTATVSGNVNALTQAGNSIPFQEYIAGSFLDAIDTSCKVGQIKTEAKPSLQEFTPIEYGANMLMVDIDKPIVGISNDLFMNPFAEPPRQELKIDGTQFRSRSYTDPGRPTLVRQRDFMAHRPSDPPAFTGQHYDDAMVGYYAQQNSNSQVESGYPATSFGGSRPRGLSIHFDSPEQFGNPAGLSHQYYAPPPRQQISNPNHFRCNVSRCNSGPFPTFESFQAHVAIHTIKPTRGKTYKCEMCPQTFSRSHGMFLTFHFPL
jgi:hypothetical protein